jgi:hypothetical protein
MGMYKSNLSPEQEKARSNTESVEAFLARGGNIDKVGQKSSSKSKGKALKAKDNKVDAQALLDAAVANGCESEVIRFLKTQGIEVQ